MKDYTAITVFIVGLFIGGLGVGYYHQMNPIIGEPVKPILDKPTEVVKCDEIKVYKHAKKKKVNLPEDVQADKSMYLADAMRLEPSQYAFVVSSVFDSNEQRIRMYKAEQPRPWLNFPNRDNRRIGIYYGPKSDEGMVGRVTVGWNNLNIKAIKFGLKADLDTDGKFFGGIGGEVLF